MTNGIDQAIEAAGGSAGFMAALKISRRTYFKWKKGAVPLGKYVAIAEKTGVPLHVLCPTVWPVPAAAQAEAA